jgi:hypothetical protein
MFSGVNMTAPRKPQDRKPKAAEQPLEFTFEHGDETFTLAPIATVAELVSGRMMRDAVMAGEEGQLRMSFFMLEKLEGADEAIEALYSKPASEMLPIVEAWMKFKTPNGVNLGE